MTDRAAENPFSTRWTRPGAIAFLFPAGVDAHTVVARLAATGWKAQITGGHGSGKSTLLESLIPALRESGRSVWHVTLRDGQRRLPAEPADFAASENGLVIVDGYEQLSRWSRWRLHRRCKRREWGLLVTAHSDVGLPTLFHTEVTDGLAQQIVQHLQQGQSVVTEKDVTAALGKHPGDLRETLFTLYDLYELYRRRSGGSGNPAADEL